MAPRTSPARNWCVTWNNYTEDWKDKLEALTGPDKTISYWIAGKETAPVTGTPHLQMYIQLTKKQRLATLKATLTAGGLPAVHLERARGSAQKNIVYCSKEGDSTQGGLLKQQGQRSDVLALRDSILAGASDLDLARDDSTCKAAASFMRFTTNLRHKLRAETARKEMEDRYNAAALRPWQQDVVFKLDTYVTQTLCSH